MLNRRDITIAFERLGQLALADGEQLRLIVVGGAAMVLGYGARQATQDIDALILSPPERRIVRVWAAIIAQEHGWPEDWLNDAAKAYITQISDGPVLFQSPGIEVRQLAVEQLPR